MTRYALNRARFRPPLAERIATEFALGHNVSSRAEVDAVIQQAQEAGAVVIKPAQDTFWRDYAGFPRL
jgi:uncharacterized glyoxalase superfamily protein PhnB